VSKNSDVESRSARDKRLMPLPSRQDSKASTSSSSRLDSYNRSSSESYRDPEAVRRDSDGRDHRNDRHRPHAYDAKR
jgi:hypothetical protein